MNRFYGVITSLSSVNTHHATGEKYVEMSYNLYKKEHTSIERHYAEEHAIDICNREGMDSGVIVFDCELNLERIYYEGDKFGDQLVFSYEALISPDLKSIHFRLFDYCCKFIGDMIVPAKVVFKCHPCDCDVANEIYY